jgi:hypothetical protein
MTCSGCGGFVNATDATCPNCGAQPTPERRRRWAILLGLAGSASLGLTIMACYGAPPCGDNAGKCTSLPDANGDAGTPDGGTPG